MGFLIAIVLGLASIITADVSGGQTMQGRHGAAYGTGMIALALMLAAVVASATGISIR